MATLSISNNQPNKANIQKPTESKHRSMRYGATFGAGIGLGDALVSTLLVKKDLKKSINEYKSFNFAQKKKAISGLHNNNMTVRQYKEFINKIMNISVPKVMIKRAVLYGSITALFGALLDLTREKMQQNKKR